MLPSPQQDSVKDKASHRCPKYWHSFFCVFLLTCLIVMQTSCLFARNKKPPSVSPSRLETIVDNYIGTPYTYGKNSAKGFDCSGFVQTVYRELGFQLPRTVKELKSGGKKIKSIEKLKPGDLVFFDFSWFKKASHVGIYIENKRFAHASKSRGVVYDSLDDTYFKKHFQTARRYIRD